jgi:hypothetical protein
MFNIAGNNASGYNINNSLRFRRSASAYLSRTMSASGTTSTWSVWVKRGQLGVLQSIFDFTDGANTAFGIQVTASDTIDFYNYATAYNMRLVTTQVFRDPSAWYHMVFVLDTTQATAANRIKIYINGSQVTAFSTATYPAQNTSMNISTARAFDIGATGAGHTNNFDGYFTEFNFIDGQALTPSSFGSTDATTGQWLPKKYSGTYGTNGFYLPFTDNSALTTSSNVGLGRDYSGNSNYWVTNNISITAGSTYDSMTDVPTNTSITAGNYSTLNPLWKGSVVTLTNGNLSYSATGATNSIAYSTYGITSGKWYAEWTQGTTPAGGAMYVGISLDSINPNHSWLGQNAGEYSYLNNNGFKANNNTQTSYGATWGINDVIGVAFDADARTITFYKNGASQGVAYSSIPAGTYYFANGNNPASTVTGHWNFGQRPFTALPTGFSAVNSFNLPSSTILKANTVMDATLYTGTGTTQTITNAGGFKPDLVWVKVRSTTGTHILTDSNRGANKQLFSNLTDAEASSTIKITGFTSTGFTLGADNGTGTGDANFNGSTYVGWQWQAGSSTVTNTSGSISAQVRANTTTGFSNVTYTGTGANATVGHGLGVAPKMVIVKMRSGADQWPVYHASTGNTIALRLNLTDASLGNIAFWNNTSPTSTTFALGNSAQTNQSAATFVAYCWAEIAGFSKFDKYTGNGSADGTFVYTGFRPAFILIKRSSAIEDWFIFDNKRLGYNADNNYLYTDLSNAEGVIDYIDILSNGFKARTTSTSVNSGTYIYMAFAENPFKNSNAR